jgi:hypothetical protein
VAEGECAALTADPFSIDLELVSTCQDLSSERLVELDDIDIGEA